MAVQMWPVRSELHLQFRPTIFPLCDCTTFTYYPEVIQPIYDVSTNSTRSYVTQ